MKADQVWDMGFTGQGIVAALWIIRVMARIALGRFVAMERADDKPALLLMPR